MKLRENEKYRIFYPSSGKAKKNFDLLYKNKKEQVDKALDKLRENPLDLKRQGIEKLTGSLSLLGTYTIRVSKNHRIFYDIDKENKCVYIVNAGKHDLYRLIKRR